MRDPLTDVADLPQSGKAYAAAATALSTPVRNSERCRRDIAYGPLARQQLDLVVPPSSAGGPAPVVLFFHGGGFTQGCKEWGTFMAPALGHAVLVLANYRLLPNASTNDVLDDARLALEWTRRSITGHGGDPARVHVAGHSAGGAIAALLALEGRSPPPASAVCLSTSFNRLAITGTSGGSYVLPPGALPVDVDAPLTLVNTAEVPFFVGWGGRERQRARVERSSMVAIELLRARNVAVDWHIDPSMDHFATHLAFGNPDHDWSVALRRWIGG